MKTLIFNLYTLQPILATSFQGDPNSDVSYSYIPGSMIRGALLGKYLRDNALPSDDIVADTEANKEVRRLFFTGETRYLNAYLMTNNDRQPRSLPVPHSIFKQKGDDRNRIEAYDFSRIETSDIPSSLSSPKPLGSDNFCTVGYGEITLYKVNRRINIHHKRDRRKGRATKESGEIFRYEAIHVSQSFQAVVICENDDDATFLRDLISKSPNLYLGGSQSAGYGSTEIRDIQIDDSWSEVGISSEQRTVSEALTITLLSDAILRDTNGQCVADYKLVQKELKLEQLLGQKLSDVKAYVSSCLIGGFNRKWGLPLPQVQALAAGSVLVFDGVKLSSTQISDLENQGIGERKIDGFGRIAVNWLGETKCFTAKSPSEERKEDNFPQLEDESIDYHQAKFMAERILRQKLDSLLIEKVNDIVLNGKIYNSQLSRIRIIARQALLDKDHRNLLLDLLNNLPTNSINKLRGIKVDGISLDQQIKKWLESCYEDAINPDSDKFWEKNQRLWLGDNRERQKLEVKISNVKAGLTIDLVREYTLKLIIAVCKKATKEEK
ncbi:MAG: type III-B CRISPR module-associated Cmr3 family protein [Pseudanabaena sp.]|jgi:CRISPR-associated protein Csx10